MKKPCFIAPALLIAATGISSWNNATAGETTIKPTQQQTYCPHDPNAPDPNWGWSVGKAPQPIKDFSYSGQPEFQASGNKLGSSPDEIHRNFASIIESNFQYGSAEHILNNLSERELQDLAKFYTSSTQGKSQPLLKIFAQNLSDQTLVRVANAFGTEPVQTAVNSYTAANVRSAFDAKVATLDSTATPASSTSELATPMATPTLDMTIPEIYLEFRTAPVGSVGPAAAIAETSMYVGKNVGVAASVGWVIGTQISNLIETYDPSLNDAIGGTVAGMIDAANQSWDLARQGQYQSSFDALFGYPVSTSGNRAGDFGEFQAMDYYWSSNGCY